MSDLRERAVRTLRANDTGAFAKPSLGQYPHQWNWDAALIAIGLSYFDIARARAEVRALLRGQWDDGMVPHILYHHGASDYFPTPDFWRTEGKGPDFATSGLTQPPVLATAVRHLHERAEDKEASQEFLREVYPKLLAWHHWLFRARDPEGTGLVAILHPWESGTDNSTRWAETMQNLVPVNVPPFQRKDKQHVRADERPVEGDYERFMYLIGFYRARDWDAQALWDEAPFLVQDTLFNAILYRANEDLRALASALSEDTGEIDGWLSRMRNGFEGLWDEDAGLYFDQDLRTGGALEESTFAALSPLYAGIPDKARARQLLEHLQNPEEYAPGEGTRYLLPSASKASPLFEPRRYWRGPVWINANWLLWKGLLRYGFDESAERIREDSLELVTRSGFVEYYDPRDGSACGATGFSWSAALALEFLASQEKEKNVDGKPRY